MPAHRQAMLLITITVWFPVAWLRPAMAVEHQDRPAPLFEQVQMEVYDTTGRGRGRRLSTIRAARGYAETKRLGFLQTALIPMLELEDVTLERRQPDGTWTQRHLPYAVVEWGRKTISTPSRRAIATLD